MKASTWVLFELGQQRSLAYMIERIDAAENKNPTPLILADKGAGFPTEKEDSDGND